MLVFIIFSADFDIILQILFQLCNDYRLKDLLFFSIS